VYTDGGCWPNPGGKMTVSIIMLDGELVRENPIRIDFSKSKLSDDVSDLGVKYARLTAIDTRFGHIATDSSNNVAEYYALYYAACELEYIMKCVNGIEQIVVYSDSALLVNQMKGLWKAKEGNYIPVLRLARGAIIDAGLDKIIEYVLVPRNRNVAGILLEKWQKTHISNIMITDDEFAFLENDKINEQR
jgi:ribonuclease HI